jgi:hypothetical protein
MKNTFLTMTIVGGLLAGSTFAAAQSVAAERLQAMAVAADTPAKHASVARQYRLQAERFEAEAVKHEKDVKDLTRVSGAIVHKWPAMATRQLQTAKDNAIAARRAARESMELADKHIRLAVEAQATGAGNVAAD